MRMLAILSVITMLCVPQLASAKEISESAEEKWEYACPTKVFDTLVSATDPDKEGSMVRFSITFVPFLDDYVCWECTADTCPKMPNKQFARWTSSHDLVERARAMNSNILPVYAFFLYSTEESHSLSTTFFSVKFWNHRGGVPNTGYIRPTQ
jgi:hypothetical protein